MSKGKLITVVGIDAGVTKDVIDNIHGKLGDEGEVVVMLDYLNKGIRAELLGTEFNKNLSTYKTAWLFDLALSGRRMQEILDDGKIVITNISLRKTIAIATLPQKKHIKTILSLLTDVPTPDEEIYIDTSINDSGAGKFKDEYKLLEKLCIGEYADMMGGETTDYTEGYLHEEYSLIAAFAACTAGIPAKWLNGDAREHDAAKAKWDYTKGALLELVRNTYKPLIHVGSEEVEEVCAAVITDELVDELIKEDIEVSDLTFLPNVKLFTRKELDDTPKVITKEELIGKLRELAVGSVAFPIAVMLTGSEEKAIDALVNGPATDCLYENVVKMGLSDLNRIVMDENGSAVTILPSE